jgi:thioesterase domain-containing protein
MELERALGLELPPTLIYEVPRFDRFCEVLRERRVPRYGPLVPLKAGAGAPPVFFIHGLGGSLVDILPTAQRVAYSGAVIGIRARGLARGEVPHSSVEGMAEDYIREIKAYQSSGPYRLCGYSFGGLVAFEIARRLSEAGEKIEFVGLFDTAMSSLRWSLRTWLSIIRRRIARLAANLRAAPLRAESAKLVGDNPPLTGVVRSLPASIIRVAASALIASARYRPGFYRGQLTLFTPVGHEPGLPPLAALWRKHARTLAVVGTEGDHSTMLSVPNADSTAASLTRCLSAPSAL